MYAVISTPLLVKNLDTALSIYVYAYVGCLEFSVLCFLLEDKQVSDSDRKINKQILLSSLVFDLVRDNAIKKMEKKTDKLMGEAIKCLYL